MNSKKYDHLPEWSDVKKELFSQEEIDQIDREVKLELSAMESLQESVSNEVAGYMAKEGIGFNELMKRLHSNPRHTSKIVKGTCNLTMASVAEVAALLGKKAKVVFFD